MPCCHPHCLCETACTYGGSVPLCDQPPARFERGAMRGLAQRVGLANRLQGSDPGFHLSDDDLWMIEFSLNFTADQL